MVGLESECCAQEAQATCCEPDRKPDCCGERHDQGCGCSAAGNARVSDDAVRENVREKYAAAATAALAPSVAQAEAGCCGPPALTATPADATGAFGSTLYDQVSSAGVPEAALNASLGCGVPTGASDLREGETVLDLGSGAGADVLISARRVGPAGKVIGLDMTDEMLTLARRSANEAGVQNVEFRKGYIEEIPLADESVDIVISNCVINLSADKVRVLSEAARVLRAGGRFVVSDVLVDDDMEAPTHVDMATWTGCVAGALTEGEFRSALEAAGFQEIEIDESHRVHEHAASATIRAYKPDHGLITGAGARDRQPHHASPSRQSQVSSPDRSSAAVTGNT
jgi:arsenite methyltransferase